MCLVKVGMNKINLETLWQSSFCKYITLVSYIILLIFSCRCYAVSTNLKHTAQISQSSVPITTLNKDVSDSYRTTIMAERCLYTALLTGYSENSSQSVISSTFYIENNCGFDINLAYYYIKFMSRDDQGNIVMLNPFVKNDNTGIIITFVQADQYILGSFGSSNFIIKNGDNFIFTAKTKFNRPFKYHYPEMDGVEILPYNALHLNGTTSVVYGRDGLDNIPVGKHGLRTLIITNYSLNTVSKILLKGSNQSSLQLTLPADITYDNTYTTCSLSGNQVLAPGASCNVVFRYTPLFEGVVNSFPVYVTALDNTSQSQITSEVATIQYNSRLTGNPQPGVEIGPNAIISGITLVKSNDMLPKPKINSFENIPAGYSGLTEYKITNGFSSTTLYGVTLPKLFGEFNYDPRTTCKLDNKLILSPSQSCYVVIRYTPKAAFPPSGALPLQVGGVDVNSYKVYASTMINEPYSSR